MNIQSSKIKVQKGQTLIETIVAIFILVTALTAGLALTMYTFSRSDRVLNDIVATSLAREGVSMVRNMRDTNWLESDDKSAGPWGLATDCSLAGVTFSCYKETWRGVPGYHNYNLSTAGSYRLEYNHTSNSWALAAVPTSYALYRLGNGSYAHYSDGVNPSPIYYRKISLSHNQSSPYGALSPNSLSELAVTSIVGWTGRGCRAMTGTPPDPSTTNCNVAVTERLTNWKDYR